MFSYAVKADWSKPENYCHWISRRLRANHERCYLPSIAIQEIKAGLQADGVGEKRIRTVKRWLRKFEVLDFDQTAAEIAGEITCTLKKQGCVLETADIQIAAIAISHKLILLTDNIRHFDRIPNLQIENWKNNPMSRPMFLEHVGFEMSQFLWMFLSVPAVLALSNLASQNASPFLQPLEWLLSFAIFVMLYVLIGGVLFGVLTGASIAVCSKVCNCNMSQG
jgi:tRNA(fMet)-specific endonuclease VapC